MQRSRRTCWGAAIYQALNWKVKQSLHTWLDVCRHTFELDWTCLSPAGCVLTWHSVTPNVSTSHSAIVRLSYEYIVHHQCLQSCHRPTRRQDIALANSWEIKLIPLVYLSKYAVTGKTLQLLPFCNLHLCKFAVLPVNYIKIAQTCVKSAQTSFNGSHMIFKRDICEYIYIFLYLRLLTYYTILTYI